MKSKAIIPFKEEHAVKEKKKNWFGISQTWLKIKAQSLSKHMTLVKFLILSESLQYNL